MEQLRKRCGNCALCVPSYKGYECCLTNNNVQTYYKACEDHRAENDEQITMVVKW